MIEVDADAAAARVLPIDTLGMPLGPGQPPRFLEALGRRTDWEHLRIGGALLTVLTDLFAHPNVHYLSGFFGPLDDPLPMPAGHHDSWGEFLAQRRLRPLTARLRRVGTADQATLTALENLSDHLERGALDDDDSPARLHGDLWSGNVVWTAQGATLIDPAAHGGHRETDLAMLALFGLPFLDEVLAGYQEVHPLRPGWQRRAGLHQVYPVGVHALLFGGGYAGQLARLVAPWA